MPQNLSSKNPLINSSAPAFKYRGVHLDLKGVAPTAERLIELLDGFAFAGYNMVLVEWEDMFPWQTDKDFQSSEAYSQETLDKFYQRAQELNIEIVPLVQILGHMETFLDPEKYHHLREVPGQSDVINPLADGASDLVTALIEETIARSPGIKYLHLGGDEAWSFGSHPDTKAFIEKNSKAALYLQHINPLLDKLANSNIRPIIWHDMMIDWDDGALKQLGAKADVMAWGYGDTPAKSDHHYNIKYIQRFYDNNVPLWGAGAYKGADGPSADLPNLVQREHNALGWIDTGKTMNFKGLVATAWSRYSTHRMQCEPIDGALDVLFMIGAEFYLGKPIGDLTQTKAQIEKALEACGEKQRFQTCHAILLKIDQERRAAWTYIQMLYEQNAVNTYNKWGPAQEIYSKLENILEKHLKNLEAAKEDFRAAFSGLLTVQTIDEYIQTRIDSIKTAAQGLK